MAVISSSSPRCSSKKQTRTSTQPKTVDATESSGKSRVIGGGRGRFAPSITGSAHPGTLLAALLCWLDARSSGRDVVLRLEDLDHTRLRPGQHEGMLEALGWLGLDWDATTWQSGLGPQHEAALDSLQARGLLYPCQCSRKERRAQGRRAPDGSFAYANTCQNRPMATSNWRDCPESLRVRLPDTHLVLEDASGLDLSQRPAAEMGDPIVRRADGVIAYHLVVVVDDAASQVSHVVRGRDLASSTATQYQLQSLLGYAHPEYRHHFLLLGSRKQKLAKLHGSMPFEELRTRHSGPGFCGLLARLAGLRASDRPCTPGELLSDFGWEKVRRDDLLFVDG
ncbi:MAG: hypothetical protein GY811_12500 [Myxococcales bacterium]|nr:hypothetical protein [Myxococcales bacterium]